MDNRNNNFDRLTNKWMSLGKLGQEAEQYVTSDPSVALFKLRLYAEKMTDEILRFEGINPFDMDNQVDKLSRLEDEQRLPTEILNIFHNIRKAGNRAIHAGEGTSEEASILLGQASRLGSWFVKKYLESNEDKKQFFSRSLVQKFRPLLFFIPITVLWWKFGGFGWALFIVCYFIIYMLLRNRLQRSGYRTTGWTMLFFLFSIEINLYILIFLCVLVPILFFKSRRTN